MLKCTYEILKNDSIFFFFSRRILITNLEINLSLHLIVDQFVEIFAAQSFSKYETQYYRDLKMMNTYKTIKCVNAFMSNRMSYIFNLRDFSMIINTTCSSSFTTLYMIYQNIKTRELK